MPSLEKDLQTAKNALSAVFDNIKETSETIAELSAIHDRFVNKLFLEMRGAVSLAFLRRLERCGKGEIIPELVVCIGNAQPFVEKLSVKDQKIALITGIKWPEGDGDHRMRTAGELSYHEAKAAFFGGCIADPETVAKRISIRAAEEARARKIYLETADERERDDAAFIRKMASAGIKVTPNKKHILFGGLKVRVEDVYRLINMVY
jgi:hypothetical protein